MDWRSVVLFFAPACGLFFVLPAALYLAWQHSSRQPFTPSGIRAVRWYPGAKRQRVYEFAEYEPGWDGLTPGHEQHITGWHRGHNPRLWPWWESGNIPHTHGWRSYDDWADGKPPEKLA